MINSVKHEKTLTWFKDAYNSQDIFSTELYNNMLKLIEDQRVEIVRLKKNQLNKLT